jgi:hypothetical protein
MPMGTPRPPRLKKQVSDDALLRAQRAQLRWIRDRLRKKGVNEGMLRALATAYEAFNAGEGMVKEVESAVAKREDLLVNAIEQSERTHALLHRIFGGVRQRIDLTVPYSAEEERDVTRGKTRTKRGATSKRIDLVGADVCDLRERGSCGTIFREVRQHAEFCRFLRRELVEAKALKKEPSPLREDVSTFPILKSKATIAKFLSTDVGLEPADIALFVLANGSDQAELPIQKKRIVHYAHKISQALSASRRRQVQAPRRSNS